MPLTDTASYHCWRRTRQVLQSTWLGLIFPPFVSRNISSKNTAPNTSEAQRQGFCSSASEQQARDSVRTFRPKVPVRNGTWSVTCDTQDNVGSLSLWFAVCVCRKAEPHRQSLIGRAEAGLSSFNGTAFVFVVRSCVQVTYSREEGCEE